MRWARPEIKTAKAMANKVLLMILDGWGKGDHGHDDVVFSGSSRVYRLAGSDVSFRTAAHRRRKRRLARGTDGQFRSGSHLNIGAGRVVYQDLVKIDRACRDDSILKNPEIVKAFFYAEENGKQVRL